MTRENVISARFDPLRRDVSGPQNPCDHVRCQGSMNIAAQRDHTLFLFPSGLGPMMTFTTNKVLVVADYFPAECCVFECR